MFNHQCCAPVRDTATGVGTRENLTWLLPACPKPAPCPRSTSPSQTIPAAEPSGCYQEEAELQLLSPSSHHLGCQEDPCLESRCSQAGTRVSPAQAEAAQARAEHEGSPWRRCVSVCTHKHGLAGSTAIRRNSMREEMGQFLQCQSQAQHWEGRTSSDIPFPR